MTKILVIGDVHGYHPWLKKIIDVAFAENIETIIQCGDFGIWPGKEGKEYLLIVSRYLVKKKIKLIFVPGNHEDYNQIEEWERTLPKNQDGHIEVQPNLFYAGKVNRWIWDNKTFASVGGAVSIDRKWRKLNESWWKQETLSEKEAKQAEQLGKVDYLFTHDCPSINPFDGLKPDIESAIHRQTMSKIGWQIKPDIWFHGHMHMPATYIFDHTPGSESTTKVFSLDADGRAAYRPSLSNHTRVLDVETGQVYIIDKLFDWFGSKFYFDKKHNKKD